MLDQSTSDMPMLMEDNIDMNKEMGEMDMSEGKNQFVILQFLLKLKIATVKDKCHALA